MERRERASEPTDRAGSTGGDGPGTDIETLRCRIDALDRQIVELLSERANCALEIGRRKDAAGQPIYQPDREAEVLANVRAANRGPLDNAAITRLFERIIDEARRLERVAGEHRE